MQTISKWSRGRPDNYREARLTETRWSRGRVARLGSAKAPTAVRIRSRPQQTSNILLSIGGFFLIFVPIKILFVKYLLNS